MDSKFRAKVGRASVDFVRFNKHRSLLNLRLFCAETIGVRLWSVTHAEAGEEGRNTILDGTVSESKRALAAHETTICLYFTPFCFVCNAVNFFGARHRTRRHPTCIRWE